MKKPQGQRPEAPAGNPQNSLSWSEGAAATRQIPAREQDGNHDHLAELVAKAESRQEALIDQAVEESFPASDPPTPKQIT